MTVKKIVRFLEDVMARRYPDYDAKCFANRRNNYIHLGLDKSLFSFDDYKLFLNEIDKILSKELNLTFKRIDPPKLVVGTRRKHDYIIRAR